MRVHVRFKTAQQQYLYLQTVEKAKPTVDFDGIERQIGTARNHNKGIRHSGDIIFVIFCVGDGTIIYAVVDLF